MHNPDENVLIGNGNRKEQNDNQGDDKEIRILLRKGILRILKYHDTRRQVDMQSRVISFPKSRIYI